MDKKIKYGFAGLVINQSFHSFEEYLTRLWESWPPARYVSGLFSSDLETGFLIFNVSFNIIGYLCLFLLILPTRRGAEVALWFWIAVETMNGIFHISWAISQQHYTPGLITAPLFLITIAYLLMSMRKGGNTDVS